MMQRDELDHEIGSLSAKRGCAAKDVGTVGTPRDSIAVQFRLNRKCVNLKKEAYLLRFSIC